MDNIQVIEKPEWVSWEDIHHIVWTAHSENRKNGVVMRNPSLSGEEIRQKIEDKGKMFCAFVDGKLAGTAAIMPKKVKFWYNIEPETISYQCFAAVLPEYAGKGIYKKLNTVREIEGKAMGFERVMFDTHEKNLHKIEIDQKNGYRRVDYKFCKDHYNVVMVKWLDGCPYSEARCKFEFAKRRIAVKTRSRVKELLKKVLSK